MSLFNSTINNTWPNRLISSPGPRQYQPTTPQVPDDDDGGDKTTIIIVCAIVGGIIFLVGIFLLCLFFVKRKRSLSNRSSGDGQVNIHIGNNLENGQLNSGLETSVQGLFICRISFL